MYCGLDFGTSNSLCATEGENGFPRLITVEQGQTDIPSAVFYPLADLNHPVFGREALTQYVEGVEGRLLRSFKRLLGTRYFPSGTMLTASKKLRFADLFISFIKNLKQAAEAQTQQELSQVVFGRPVRFSQQELADKSGVADLAKIANSIGFKQVEFQYEPIAAAFFHERLLTQEQLAIVVDIGGGTSDFSVLRLGPARKNLPDRSTDILASSGMTLGGTDFDSMLSKEQVMEHFGYKSTYGVKNLFVPNWPYTAASDWNRISVELYLRKTYLAMRNVLVEAHAPEKINRFLYLIENLRAHHLLREVESAKISLSQQMRGTVDASFIEENLSISVNRKAFEAGMESYVLSLQKTAQEALTVAGVSTDQIELVIMTGGGSGMPVIQQAFTEMFPQAMLSAENKMGSVCEGLLYDARRKFGV